MILIQQFRVYAAVSESEDEIGGFTGMFFDSEDFGASYPGPSVDGSLVVAVNDPINERWYYPDFTITTLFNRFGADFRFTLVIRGTTIDSFTFQRGGETRIEFTDLRVTVTCASTIVIFGTPLIFIAVWKD